MLYIFITIALLVFGLMYYNHQIKQANYNHVISKLNQIEKIKVNAETKAIEAVFINGRIYNVNIPFSELEDALKNQDVEIQYCIPGFFASHKNYFITLFILFILILGLMQLGDKMENSFDIGVNVNNNDISINTDDVKKNKKIFFDDIGGLHNEKQEFKLIKHYIENRELYKKENIKFPKGILVYGPTGNGKTLLAKALANEVDCDFMCMHGSDFTQLWVGAGAYKINELFKKIENYQKKNKFVIVYIDEIDTLGAKRSQNGSNSEDAKTLNALLAKMDGFQELNNFIIIGSTNLKDNLDSAFLRRFTKQIFINNPNKIERLEIIKKITSKFKLNKNVDLEYFNLFFSNCSTAYIEDVFNQAKIISLIKNDTDIKYEHIVQAFEEKEMGFILNRASSLEAKKNTAFHESGHLFAKHYLHKDKVTIFTINIQDRNKTLGYVWGFKNQEENDSKEDCMNDVAVFLAGRAAEHYFFNNTTSGASNDLQMATNIARNMVMHLGWGNKNKYLSDDREKYYNNIVSNQVKNNIDEDIQEILNIAQKKADKIIETYANQINQFAKLLLKFEVFYTEDITYIIKELEKDCSDENLKNIEQYLRDKAFEEDECKINIKQIVNL